MSDIWNTILDGFRWALEGLHGLFDGLFGDAAWGWAIIALTLIVRVILLPLAIKQTHSMRRMQELQPKIKGLQKKHKVDRDLMRKDPETYRARKQKLNEEMMALYKEEGVNPAGGCLPLLLQMPIFIALYSVLRSYEPLQNAPFYFVTDFINVAEDADAAAGLGAVVSAAGWPGWLLVVLMAGTMYYSSRQMMARTSATATAEVAQQQKIMMYVMPVFLAFISINLPLGVILYWVTTNLWQVGQQAVILREVAHDAPGGDSASGDGSGDGRRGGGGPKGPTGGKRPQAARDRQRGGSRAAPDTPARARKRAGSQDHLPRRGR